MSATTSVPSTEAVAVAVRVRGVCHVYRGAGEPVEALRGVDLDIAPGEHVALVGPSGCGKSTLLSVVGGLERPTGGEVVVGATMLATAPEKELARFRRSRVGFVFQAFELIAVLTAVENVALPLQLSGVPSGRASDTARAALADIGLENEADKLPDQLSGGQRQRVAIARVLAHRPPLVLADEPTGSLDSATGADVLDVLFDQIGQVGSTLLVASHDPEVAARCHRAVRLRDGRVL